MTNTMYIPMEIEKALADAKRIASRIELVKRYADEAEFQSMSVDEAFAGADLVMVEGDLLLAFEVVNWQEASVRLTLSRLVADEDTFETEDLWSITLVEAPWQLFSVTLTGAIAMQAKSQA